MSEQKYMTLAGIECKAIEISLKRNSYNLTETAKELGIGRATLYRKIKEYGLTKPTEKKPNEGSGT